MSSQPHRSVLVEGFGPDSVACAAFLARGRAVTIAGDGVATNHALSLRSVGVEVVSGCELDTSALTGDVFVVDCWTSELAPRVVRHRDAGAHLTSIGDLVLASAPCPVVGVTGSGGKTTATRIAAAAMRAGGLRVAVATTARAGNAWPTGELLDVGGDPDWLAVELTSTHLAYMERTPQIAVVTSLWPDHVELHGSIGRYRAAKARIFGSADQIVVVNGDDSGAVDLADLATGKRVLASATGPVEHGIGVEAGEIVLRREGLRLPLGPVAGVAYNDPIRAVALTGLCAAIWAGADPGLAVRVLDEPLVLPHRRRVLGSVNGVQIIDDTAATTPRKTLASLGEHDPARTVLVVGGQLSITGTAVLSSSEERAELDQALKILKACRLVVVFGPAAAYVTIDCLRVDSLAEACSTALASARPDDVVIVSPMFPVDIADRERLPALFGIGDR